MAAPLVTIFGGSGFIGRYVAQRMAKAGWRVRVAVRRPNEAIFVKPYGVVGQVEPIQANIRDDASTAAAIDGARPWRRFWTIVFPLLSPVTLFLIVVNMVYAFVDTFGVVHATTEGGPAGATQILVYKVFQDGFIGLDLGGSAAQSVILMLIVIALTTVQFRYIERKVHY